MPAASPPVVILGAGLTGLAAAHELRVPCVVAEREATVGGHARSVRQRGHTFDVTGHWLHLRDPRTQRLLAQVSPADAWVEVERRTAIHAHGALLPYPFQANLYGLPLAVVRECLVEFIAAREALARGGKAAPRTFAEFAEARFGAGIARHFFVPYNRKLWGAAFDALDASWVDRYVPTPTVDQVVAGAIGIAQEGLGYNARFLYPRAGGIDALPRGLAAAIEARAPGTIRRGSPVEEVDVRGRRVKLAGEADWRPYAALISTIPLPELIARIPAAPPEIREAAAALRWIRWRYLDVATRAPVPADYHWVYVPSPALPFFRVGVYSNAVASMAPAGAASLYVELSDRDGPIDRRAVAQGLVEVGALAQVDDLAFTELREIEYAYVVFDDDHGPATAALHRWLGGVGVRSCGRYGAWIYNSMEDSMIQGMDAARWAEGQVAAEEARPT
ncbi:MAG: FAD-dependent oxidoreductase [Nannocystaceae bacterium]